MAWHANTACLRRHVETLIGSERYRGSVPDQESLVDLVDDEDDRNFFFFFLLGYSLDRNNVCACENVPYVPEGRRRNALVRNTT